MVRATTVGRTSRLDYSDMVAPERSVVLQELFWASMVVWGTAVYET